MFIIGLIILIGGAGYCSYVDAMAGFMVCATVGGLMVMNAIETWCREEVKRTNTRRVSPADIRLARAVAVYDAKVAANLSKRSI